MDDSSRTFDEAEDYIRAVSAVRKAERKLKEGADDVHELEWMVLGGRGMAYPEETANHLRAAASLAEEAAEMVEDLDNPHQKREELGNGF